MSIAPLEDVDIDLNWMFEESIPCSSPDHDTPATHAISHPGCRIMVCSPCAGEAEDFLKEVRDHIITCPNPHAHDLVCAPCGRTVTVDDIAILPI